jgi:hypothetical protein
MILSNVNLISSESLDGRGYLDTIRLANTTAIAVAIGRVIVIVIVRSVGFDAWKDHVGWLKMGG